MRASSSVTKRLRAGIERLRAGLFGSWISGAITIALGALVLWLGWRFLDWAVLRAVWTVPGTDTRACRAVEGQGACWALIHEKARLILFGLYPYGQQWRPGLVILLFGVILAASGRQAWWNRWLLLAWVAVLAVIGVLMAGGLFGLPVVGDDQWGGLPVSLILATFGIALAFPLAILVALGRRSRLRGLSALCAVYVELIRGIPLISVLFMASVMFPLFLPPGVDIPNLLRAQFAIALFEAAYLSEVIRASLRALPEGQEEAAKALGLGYWRRVWLVMLPQALRIAVPAMANSFIGFFKATTLVTVIGVFDLLTAAKRSVADPAWQGFGTEAYLFVAAIFFVICATIARYSGGLEKRLARR